MGEDAGSGVFDRRQRVFGYENLLVCDGSAVPANPGVNPSLTITAMTRYAMSHIPTRAEAESGEDADDLAPAGVRGDVGRARGGDANGEQSARSEASALALANGIQGHDGARRRSLERPCAAPQQVEEPSPLDLGEPRGHALLYRVDGVVGARDERAPTSSELDRKHPALTRPGLAAEQPPPLERRHDGLHRLRGDEAAPGELG